MSPCKYVTPGLNRSVWSSINAGKGDFNRYAESGQLLIDRTKHLGEWWGVIGWGLGGQVQWDGSRWHHFITESFHTRTRAKTPDVLEWVWFINSFGDKHVYDYMYGDKVRETV
jgi:hypothetical protein